MFGAVFYEAAESNETLLRLHDLPDLCRWMQGHFLNEDEWREIPSVIELAPGEKISIPKEKIWLSERNDV